MKKINNKISLCIISVVLGLCCGLFLGVHWRVIRAALTGSEMPETPEGHKCCHKCRRGGTDND